MKKDNFEISNSNGTLRGCLTLPGNSPRGCVVCLHGGPGGNMHGNTDVFDQASEILSALNFVTVQFSMFGSPPSDGNQQATSLRTQMADYRSVLAYVSSRFSCPMHVIGESAGATIAALCWVENIRSYVLLWPAFDLRDTDFRSYLSAHWWETVESNGFINDNGVIIGRDLFLELLLTDFSPCFDLPNTDVLIVHGRADKEVSYSQSLKALASARQTVAFLTHEAAGHGFKSTEHRCLVLAAIEDWFRRR